MSTAWVPFIFCISFRGLVVKSYLSCCPGFFLLGWPTLCLFFHHVDAGPGNCHFELSYLLLWQFNGPSFGKVCRWDLARMNLHSQQPDDDDSSASFHFAYSQLYNIIPRRTTKLQASRFYAERSLHMCKTRRSSWHA